MYFFDQLEFEFKSLWRKYFISELEGQEYLDQLRKAKIVYKFLLPIRDKFLDINDGPIFNPFLSKGLSFSRRFLKGKHIKELDCSNVIINCFNMTFDLGLLMHLFNFKLPTRAFTQNVDLNRLWEEWSIIAIVADIKYKDMDISSGYISSRFYEYWFNDNIKKLLSSYLKFGFIKVEKSRSYFRNIFFSGALLGLQYDFATNVMSIN